MSPTNGLGAVCIQLVLASVHYDGLSGHQPSLGF